MVHYYLEVLDNYPLLSIRPMDMLVASNVTIYKVLSALDLSYILSPRNLLKPLSLLSYLLHRLDINFKHINLYYSPLCP